MTNKNGDNEEFVFLKHDSVGAAAAEDDTQYLEHCFLDTGDLACLMDCENPKRLIVGRTGAGKSALIDAVNRHSKNTVCLSPHSLSLNYIANSNVISFFEEVGVNLGAFYSLLWKHILVVELLKKKFNICNEESQKVFMRHIRNSFFKRDKNKEIAVDYLENWGNKFWLTTEERIHEITSKIENNLSGSLGSDDSLSGVAFTASAAKALSEEQRKVVTERGRKAVSQVQIRELENVIGMLDADIFDDPQAKYYITIDMLDEDWTDARLRFKLIRSLIDVIRHFGKIENVKIIAALRQDLLDKVLHSQRDVGFQEEKYESLYLDIDWSNESLQQVVDLRIGNLVKRRYTKHPVTSSDIFRNKVDGLDPLEYMIKRTFKRPRDIILFVNECIAKAEGKSTITASIIKEAEQEYSYKRLQSLATEWQLVYPYLFQIAQIFDGMKSHFHVSEITEEILTTKYSEFAMDGLDYKSDRLMRLLDTLYTSSGNFNSVRNTLVRDLYMIGLFGIKVGPSSPVKWSYSSRLSIPPGQVKASSQVYIHPTFYMALSIRPVKP